MDPECGGDGEIYWDEVNEKLEAEGMPPFESHAEMMGAIQEEMDSRANAIKAMITLLSETGADSLADLVDKGGEEVGTGIGTGHTITNGDKGDCLPAMTAEIREREHQRVDGGTK